MAHTIEAKLNGAAGAGDRILRAFGIVRRVVSKIMENIIIWQERAEQRAALRGLDQRMLKDIGISAVDALREWRKPFWLP